MLLVGLGNPGSEYKRNRHNIGFMALDRVAEKYGAPAWSKKFGGEWAEVKIPSSCGLTTGSRATSSGDPAIKSRDDKLFLLKPQTYMNLSGESVSRAASFYKIPIEDIVVFHDELDLEPGRLRVKQGGGAGGHNGLKSIDQYVGNNYWRVRIGIGHPGDKDMVSDYVLSNFTKDEWVIQEKMLATIAAEIPQLLSGDEVRFMNNVALANQL